MMRKCATFALMLFGGMALIGGAQTRYDDEAVRLNNRGVAQMGQQFTERAAESFSAAVKKEPKLAQAEINEGIALLTLQKLEEAEKALRAALVLDERSAQAWYNLGLAQHAENSLDGALASFQQAVKYDPRDADSYYFEGACYQEMKQYDKAIEAFNHALAVNPLHASAEFGLARSLQRAGRTDEAREHFKRFQHLSSTKISSPIGLSYGEQGHYSTATTVEEPTAMPRAMIPVLLEARPLVATDSKGSSPSTTTGGACMLDVAGSGKADLVLMQSGAQAIRVLHQRDDGSFEELDSQAAGLKASGYAVACAVGDYDGDGLNDLAVALDDAVLLFRNLG